MAHPHRCGPAIVPMQIPLFPLRSVLFPGGLLPLQIFEVRYLDMINRCHAAGTPFGVVCLTEGDEVRRRAAGPTGEAFAQEAFHPIGTLALITELTRPQPGLMRIRSEGGQRFRLSSSTQLAHGLWMGEAELLPDDLPVTVPEDLAAWKGRLEDWLAMIAQRIPDEAERPVQPPYRLDDCGWLANRFAELLPIEPAAKQNLMALDNPLLRLELVVDVLEHLDELRQQGHE